MPLAVFDIDGTLTDTMDVDVQCYEEAVRTELGIQIPGDWAELPEVTDAAILMSACERLGVPAPDAETQRRVAARLGELLALELARAPARFRAVPGATEIFGELRAAGWRVAMATGAWRPSAVVKLEGADIPWEGVPLATSSDHRARADIIRHAVAASALAEGEPVVYVGDGVWDGRAARSCGYGFLGVAPAGREARLLDAGAGAVVQDFSRPEVLLTHLRRLASDAEPGL